MQVKLLRVLQEKEFERLGGTKTIKVNIRIITATNRNLEALLKENKFREDLYYRLNVYSILLPPLKERKTDILLLAEHFLLKFNKEDNKNIKRISTLAIDLLNSYHWPGNVRELENCMQRAVLLCKSDVIQASHLPPTLQRIDTSENNFSLSLTSQIENLEKEIIIDAFKKTKGNMVKAAKLLSISRRILGYKAANYNIDYKNFR
ncbi:sigma 54-interacting transcriptional regulator [Candidatus Margulisiibacteriota bacterium]